MPVHDARRAGIGGEPGADQPFQHCRLLGQRQPGEVLAARAAPDAPDVGEVALGVVIDATAVLQGVASGGQVAARVRQRAADVGRLLQQQDAGAPVGGRDGAGQTGRSGSHNDH
ncbi:hypothetical protein CS0771_47020 [Catellatospora sp. IY07-71]|nr:hypothetical protein CS0771_47020 [Catellatospora sp. IY07-71]